MAGVVSMAAEVDGVRTALDSSSRETGWLRAVWGPGGESAIWGH